MTYRNSLSAAKKNVDKPPDDTSITKLKRLFARTYCMRIPISIL